MHYARDVNDERALAAEDRPAIRRGGHWTLLAVVVVVLAVLAVASGRDGEEVPLAADCDTPAIGVSSSLVTAGAVLRYRLTGPDDGPHPVTPDREAARGGAGPPAPPPPPPPRPAPRP